MSSLRRQIVPDSVSRQGFFQASPGGLFRWRYYWACVCTPMEHSYRLFTFSDIAPSFTVHSVRLVPTNCTMTFTTFFLLELSCVCYAVLHPQRAVSIPAAMWPTAVSIPHWAILLPACDAAFFVHLLPSDERILVFFFVSDTFFTVYTVRPSIPDGSLSTSRTGTFLQSSGLYFRCFTSPRPRFHSNSSSSESLEEYSLCNK